jgi:hypothetical protein
MELVPAQTLFDPLLMHSLYYLVPEFVADKLKKYQIRRRLISYRYVLAERLTLAHDYCSVCLHYSEKQHPAEAHLLVKLRTELH